MLNNRFSLMLITALFFTLLWTMTGCALPPSLWEKEAPPPMEEILEIPTPPVKEFRAVWLTRFEYTRDFTPTRDPDSMQMYIAEVIDKAARANFNTILFQVRGNGDAYYRSNLEPWGVLLTDTLGKNPGWDPLQFAIDRAHDHGLELHAWVNTFPVHRGVEPPPETVPRSPYLEHPEWLVCDSSGNPMKLSEHYVSFSPGIPAVHEYIISVASDIALRYNIDGMHFDYIRYPEIAPRDGYSHDSISVALFNSEAGNPWNLDWEDWQREQLNRFVIKLYNRLMKIDSTLLVSAAVIGSYNEGGWNAYHKVYQDPRRWTELGKMDMIAPMIYAPRESGSMPFLRRAADYRDYFSVERFVLPGIGSYLFNQEKPLYTWAEAEGQIDDLRRLQFPGMGFFNAHSLLHHWEDFAQTRFRYPANIPPLSWKDSVAPGQPEINRVFVSNDSLFVTWSNNSDSTEVVRYNIWAGPDSVIASTNSQYLITITVPADSTWSDRLDKISWKDTSTDSIFISVSALDAYWNESKLAPSRGIRLPEVQWEVGRTLKHMEQ